MAFNSFCWMCGQNFPFKGYKGSKHLDEDGNVPCFDCLEESGAFDDPEDQEEG